LRRLLQDPERILAPYVKPGMTALDAGCAMGFFSLAMAEMVGSEGRIICVDLQQKMIDGLSRRARRAGVLERIDARVCSRDGLGIEDLAEGVDFALAFAVVHELPDARAFLAQIHAALRPAGQLLIAEPKGHVRAPAFEDTILAAQQAGLTLTERPAITRSLTALLQKR
jgi:2-polyprenyl-3-methyl-5-hydroxy-6-metoxy-1,4-benzoquinol methylase